MRRTAILGLAGICLLAVTSAPAQKKAISREIAFAKGLATEFGFVGLGNQVLEDLLKRKDLGQEEIDRINLEKCDLLLLASRATPDIQKKVVLYEEAIQKIQEVLDRFKGKDVAHEARLLMARAALAYGQVISALMEEETDPQKKDELRQKAEKMYKAAIRACNETLSDLKDVKDTDKDALLTYYRAWMNKGELEKNWATVAKTKTEKSVRLESAKSTLEDFIFEVGEDTPAGAHALILHAQCSEMEGKLADALDDFAGTKDTIWETFTRKDDNNNNSSRVQPPRAIPVLVPVLEEAYYNQIRLLNKMGKTDEAVKAGEELLARFSQLKDVQPSKPYGLLARLEFAKALQASGEPVKIKKAVKLANEVSDKAGTSYIRTEAQRLINDILQTYPDLVASPKSRFQAAEGRYRAGNALGALKAAKDLLRVLVDDELKKEFGLKVCKLMGRALTDLSRYAEACYAYGMGCELFGSLGKGDPKYKRDVKELALRCSDLARKFQRYLPNRDMAMPLKDYADNIVTLYAPNAADFINLNSAKELIVKKSYDQALAKLKLIPPTSQYYEEALVTKAEVYMKKGDFSTARRFLRDYMEKYIPAHSLVEGSDAMATRLQLQAKSLYDLGYMAFKEAEGDKSLGLEPDPAKWKDVLSIFARIPREFPGQKNFVEFAWYYIGRAYTALGDLKKAQEAYKNLKAAKKNSRLIPNLALFIFTAHQSRIRKLKKQNPLPKKALVQACKEAISFADEYIRGNPLPQYAVLYETFNYSLIVGDQEKALEIFHLLQKFYGKNPKFNRRILIFVKPKVAEILQKNGDFNRAKPLVEELLAAYKKGRWPLPVLWLGVFEYGGWLEVDGVQVKEILGLNQPKKALEPPLELMPTLYKTVQAPESKFSLQWYAIVAQYTYLAYRAGLKDPRWTEEARRYLRVAESIDNFAGVKHAPYLLKGREKALFDKMSPAEKKRRLQEQEKQRQDLYRIFQYLKSRLAGA